MTHAAVVAAATPPIGVREFAELALKVTAEHGDGTQVAMEGRHLVFRTAGTVCGCASCDDADRAKLVELTGDRSVGLCRVMIVCPDCGNKRCPRANHHDNPCTQSNEPGQNGSAYPR